MYVTMCHDMYVAVLQYLFTFAFVNHYLKQFNKICFVFNLQNLFLYFSFTSYSFQYKELPQVSVFWILAPRIPEDNLPTNYCYVVLLSSARRKITYNII